MEPKTYLEIVSEARQLDITAKTDSELINKILYKFFTDLPVLTLQIEQLKRANEQKRSTIETLEATIKELKLAALRKNVKTSKRVKK